MGQDTLLIYDDLSKHAVAYRQMSLILKRPACRDAYPADIFYIHSRLLERASQMATDLGGGSLTALPIVETQLGDVSSYIPTNLISITDGQIFLDSDVFNSGQKPALNIGLSISRVGSAAQVPILKGISSKFKMESSQFSEIKHLLNFEGDLSEGSLKVLIRGLCIYKALQQFKHTPVSITKQIFLIYIVVMGYIDYLSISIKNHVYDSMNRVFSLENIELDNYTNYNFKPLDFFSRKLIMLV
jgi:F-type H+-transporting ATPase subunit alpha